MELVAARLRVIGEPTRIRLLGLLDCGDATVHEVTERLGTTPQNASKHLGVLYQSGIVSRHRQGSSNRYSLVDWTGWWLVEQIATSVATHLDEQS